MAARRTLSKWVAPALCAAGAITSSGSMSVWAAPRSNTTTNDRQESLGGVLPCGHHHGVASAQLLQGRVLNIPTSAAVEHVLKLNEAMLDIYARGMVLYKYKVRSTVPIILGLFSGGGGRLILYAPGREAEEAPPVPLLYTMAKSVAHSALAMHALLTPVYAASRDPHDGTWLVHLAAYRAAASSARMAVLQLPIQGEASALLLQVLDRVLPFMDKVLTLKQVSPEELESFARDVEPFIECCIALAADTQVKHWSRVLRDWRDRLGDQWHDTYAVTNTIYVTRQNNILYSIFAQAMGADAINDRLLMFETLDNASPEQMLDMLCRVLSDRELSTVFFGEKRVMDFELLGWEARKAIERDAATHGEELVLPPLVPFNSHEWPWHTDPASGDGPASFDELHKQGLLPAGPNFGALKPAVK